MRGLGSNKKKRTRRLVGVALVGASMSVLTYAATASNTVPSAKMGAGSGAITGYTVSAVSYGLNATNPQNIDTVTFTLDAAPAAGATVKIKLVASGSTWFTCTMSGSPAVNASCTTTGAAVSTADQLTVVVAD